MNLLIVDDQIHVLHGLEKGISWDSLGFKQVFTALNPIEARQIIMNNSIDILLCDIEMPFEDGLSLIRWIRKEKYAMRCILLTSHSDFAYAKEAIQLDITEYVVQPAPYDEIVQTVRKAQTELLAERKQRDLSRMGEKARESRGILVSLALSTFLQNRQSTPYQIVLKRNEGELPGFDSQVCLALIRIVRWNCVDDWKNDTISYGLNNILRECFDAYGQKTALTELTPREYLCLIWGQDGLQSEELLVRQFEFLRSFYAQHFQFEIAVYLESPINATEAPDSLERLRRLHEYNLSQQSMVQTTKKEAEKKEWEYSIPAQVAYSFERLLEQGYPDTAAQQVHDYLDQQAERGDLTPALLCVLYQNIMQALYSASEQTGVDLRKLFDNSAAANATQSLDGMSAFIDFVCQHYTAEPSPADAARMVEQVQAYIEQNLDKELRRDQIADHIHISASYLSRIFKQKTGMALKEYIIERRMHTAQAMLRTTSLPVNLIAVKVGYYNFSQFSQIYKNVIGHSPSAERKTGQGGDTL